MKVMILSNEVEQTPSEEMTRLSTIAIKRKCTVRLLHAKSNIGPNNEKIILIII